MLVADYPKSSQATRAINITCSIEENFGILQRVTRLIFHLPPEIVLLGIGRRTNQEHQQYVASGLQMDILTLKNYKKNPGKGAYLHKLINLAKITSQAIIIKSITHYELVGYVKPNIIQL